MPMSGRGESRVEGTRWNVDQNESHVWQASSSPSSFSAWENIWKAELKTDLETPRKKLALVLRVRLQTSFLTFSFSLFCFVCSSAAIQTL